MPTIERIDWYDTPRYYDMVFDEETDVEADFLEGALARYSPAGRKRGPRRVLEPACGSGRLVVELARRGWKVTGSDLSQPMLDYAAERLASHGLKARLELADMADLPPRGPFELAHCLVSTFKYLPDEAAATAHLAGVARDLVPGGIYVLGFHLSDYSRTKLERERWVVERDGVQVTCNIQGWPPDRAKRRERVRSRLVVREEGRERRTETEWWFRTYSAAQVRRLLARVPELELVAVHKFTYDLDVTVPLEEGQFDIVLILRKRD